MISHNMAVSGWPVMPSNVSVRCIQEPAYDSGGAHTKYCVHICEKAGAVCQLTAQSER